MGGQRDGALATVGITDHAQQALGDVVFVSVPAPGTKVTGRRTMPGRSSPPSPSATCTPPSTAR